jgi:hypothetical protein
MAFFWSLVCWERVRLIRTGDGIRHDENNDDDSILCLAAFCIIFTALERRCSLLSGGSCMMCWLASCILSGGQGEHLGPLDIGCSSRPGFIVPLPCGIDEAGILWDS